MKLDHSFSPYPTKLESEEDMQKNSSPNIQELMASFFNSDSFFSDQPLNLPLFHSNLNPISQTSFLHSSPPSSAHHNNKSKRKRNSERVEEVEEKAKDVIHVRAKRGQATDSHSLAERVRREKINDKLRCLQELVPGCYKTMGMAVMLDVIIDYVQSLQQQIEFLSMKLTAATMHYDFHASDHSNVNETLQRNNTSTWQVQEREKMGGEEGDYFNPTWPLH